MRKEQRSQLHFFVSEFELVSQAHPRETLAPVRATPIAGTAALMGQVQGIVYVMKHQSMNNRCTHFLLAECVIISQSGTTQGQPEMPC